MKMKPKLNKCYSMLMKIQVDKKKSPCTKQSSHKKGCIIFQRIRFIGLYIILNKI